MINRSTGWHFSQYDIGLPNHHMAAPPVILQPTGRFAKSGDFRFGQNTVARECSIQTWSILLGLSCLKPSSAHSAEYAPFVPDERHSAVTATAVVLAIFVPKVFYPIALRVRRAIERPELGHDSVRRLLFLFVHALTS
jgi:hypothetical protein